MDDNKAKALSAALSQIEKQFGKGSIMRMGDSDIGEDVQAVSTGSLGLDIALRIENKHEPYWRDHGASKKREELPADKI